MQRRRGSRIRVNIRTSVGGGSGSRRGAFGSTHSHIRGGGSGQRRGGGCGRRFGVVSSKRTSSRRHRRGCPPLALHCALRRMAGPSFLLGFLSAGGCFPKARRGRVLLGNSPSQLVGSDNTGSQAKEILAGLWRNCSAVEGEVPVTRPLPFLGGVDRPAAKCAGGIGPGREVAAAKQKQNQSKRRAAGCVWLLHDSDPAGTFRSL